MRNSFEQIRNVLYYDQKTGIFQWRISHGNRQRGMVAGHIDDQGRPKVQVNGCRYIQSRLAWFWMTGALPKNEIDHINNDHADNRWSNLREATRSENECNKTIKANNTSGAKGVRKVNNRWRAEIMIGGKAIHVGYFATRELAQSAYAVKAKELHGDFACCEALGESK